MSRYTVALALLLYSLSIHNIFALTEDEKEQRWYTVELIVFEHPQNYHWDRERFSSGDVELPLIDNAIELTPFNLSSTENKVRETDTTETQVNPDEQQTAQQPFQWPEPFSIPDREFFKLTENAVKIHKNPKLNLLIHTAWQQPGLASKDALAVRLNDLVKNEVYIESEPTSTTYNQENVTSLSDTLKMLSEDKNDTNNSNLFDSIYQNSTDEKPEIKEPEKRFDGTITVRLSRYLHLDVDLLYFDPDAKNISNTDEDKSNELTIDKLSNSSNTTLYESQSNPDQLTESKPSFYQFKHSRKMRSQELHYIDHPRLGILALITPIQPPEEITAEETTKN